MIGTDIGLIAMMNRCCCLLLVLVRGQHYAYFINVFDNGSQASGSSKRLLLVPSGIRLPLNHYNRWRLQW